MKIEVMADDVEVGMASVLRDVKGKYCRAIEDGNGAKLDELFRGFGMNAQEIECARGLVDEMFLHSAIIGSE